MGTVQDCPHLSPFDPLPHHFGQSVVRIRPPEFGERLVGLLVLAAAAQLRDALEPALRFFERQHYGGRRRPGPGLLWPAHPLSGARLCFRWRPRPRPRPRWPPRCPPPRAPRPSA